MYNSAYDVHAYVDTTNMAHEAANPLMCYKEPPERHLLPNKFLALRENSGEISGGDAG